MKQKLINIIHKAATGELTVDEVAEKCEDIFKENQIGQQYSIFDESTHHANDLLKFINSDEIQTLNGMKDCKWNPMGNSKTHFDGSDIVAEFDHDRLSRQIKIIYDLMIKGRWHTLAGIAYITGFPESSISANLRHLRKPKMGAHTVNKRRKGEPKNGLWEYQLMKNLL